MTFTDIQKALSARGFDPGPIDGVWGARTTAAVRAFQASKGLKVDGIVGPRTAAALGLDATVTNPLIDPSLVWFQAAWRLLGTKEAPGTSDNPNILQWASRLGIPYRRDDVPWCGLFVAHCIGSTLSAEPLPNNPLSARNWLKFGVQTTGQAGAVAVFYRGALKGWLGHVAFYVGQDDEAYHVLGGNQSNAVSVARIAKNRLLGFRWPSTVPPGSGKPVLLTPSGQLSTNEG
ncbi:TIGR02594 family protein [Brevundimonas sp. SL130]|uniref:NlpC/P60 family protein n=1 Tax=Brevundimonas sp. SL130 TaxID=2995143 RepID=UPI00226CF0E5|nr:TIGR02594 family protein [Brevundimonas sp. SL130]WAC59223.1 TIGR02594 family protein [Brevundimonas sp. SL130]